MDEPRSFPLDRVKEPLPISALNQFLYCPRRVALIHSKGIFGHNDGRSLRDICLPETAAHRRPNLFSISD